MIPRNAIQSLRVYRGFRARHPLLLAAFGIAVLGAGLIPALHLVRWLTRGGEFWNLEALALGLIPVGGWALFQAPQRGYLLVVDATDGRHRFEFEPTVEAAALEVFCSEVEQELGLPVERSGL